MATLSVPVSQRDPETLDDPSEAGTPAPDRDARAAAPGSAAGVPDAPPSSDLVDRRRPGAVVLGELLAVSLPPALLLISMVLGWLGPRNRGVFDHVEWAVVPAVLLLALRVLLERTLRSTGPDSRPLTILYALHLVLTAAAIVLNPLVCIFAFVGYLDCSRYLDHRRMRAVVVVTALLSALGQSGGVTRVAHEPWLFAGLAVVNLLIASGMMYLAVERERMLEDRERALAEMQRVQRENARLQERLVASARRDGADEERARLSREIHDTVAQGLVGVIRQLEAGAPGTDADSRQHLAIAEEAARDCLLETRRAVEALGPYQLHDQDVVEALSGLVARWARTHRVVATLDADDAEREAPHGDVLVRVAQESLANVARHAEADSVTVTLETDGAEQLLQVTDDGVGFDAEQADRGHGLDNMAARLGEVGGRIDVDSEPGTGTTVTARVPG